MSTFGGINLNPFRQQRRPMQRVQLPASAGRSISVGGLEFAADDEGFVDVPADLAVELEAHLPKEPISTGTHAPAELASIAKIDAEARALQAQKETLEAARAASSAMAGASSEATTELIGLAEKKRNAVADFLLGIIKREDLAEIEQQRSKAAARVEKDRQSRELGELGVDAINDRIAPIDQQLQVLRDARSLAVRRACRAHAERAATEYRDFLNATARAYGVVQAYAFALSEMEGIGTNRAVEMRDRQSFDFFKGNEIGPFPGLPALEAFKNQGFHVSVQFDAADLRTQVRQRLANEGLVA